MRNFKHKTVKTLIVKFIAITIVCCYIGGPIHHQIGSVFHEVSELFIMPSSILSHETNKSKSIGHTSYEHISFQTEDQNQFIDLFNQFFDAANSSKVPNDDSLLKYLKIDKHVTSDTYNFQINHFKDDRCKPLLQLVKHVALGHLQVLDEPPRTAHSVEG